MKLAIENKKGNIGFFKIDGRKLNLFIEEAERVNEDIASIWTYTGTIKGVFKNVKTIKNY